MENMDLLKKVEKVDAPLFLMTRIRAKIQAAEAESLPISWKLAGSLAFGLLVLANILVMKMEKPARSNAAESLAISLELQPSNQFYDE